MTVSDRGNSIESWRGPMTVAAQLAATGRPGRWLASRGLARTPLRAALALVVVFGAGAASAAAAVPTFRAPAWPKPWAARFMSPDTGAVVTDGSVHAVVQLAPGVKRLRAWVGERKVTGLFRETDHGRVLEATLDVGRTPGLGYGSRNLYVETFGAEGQQWWTERQVLIARPGAGLLERVSAGRVPGAGAIVRATASRAGDRVSFRVDGGQWRAMPGAGRRHTVPLTGAAGLQPGSNLITVRVLDVGAGRYETRRVSLDLPVDVPVAGAGAVRQTPAGQLVRFSAAQTSVPGGLRPRYRWTLVSRPAGSHAELRQAMTADPVLRPDRPGRYVLRLTVSGPADGVSDSAMTTLDAVPDASALGIPIDTITPGGITVGQTRYPSAIPGDALQMLVLSRSTLAEVSNVSYANDDAGASALLTAVQKLTASDLVIIAKPQASVTNATDATANSTINKALAQIGVDPVSQQTTNGTQQCTSTLPCGMFSAIGVPGLPVGQGNVNAGLSGLGQAPGGDLRGYMQRDLNYANYTFVSTSRVSFDTGAADADPAVITIGSEEAGSPIGRTTFTSENLNGAAGFFVVVLGAGDLTTRASGTFADTATGLGSMAALLGQFTNSPNALVIVRSIGNVTRVNTAAWDQVAGDLQAAGGSSLYFDALNGTTSSYYTQVGPGGTPGYPSPWTQVSTAQSGGAAQLNGLLAYNQLGQLYPDESYQNLKDPGRPLAGTLAGLISLPSTGWPEDAYATGERNALDCIAAHVDPAGGLQTPIQSNYTNGNLDGDWTQFASTINQAGYFTTLSAYAGCGAFTQDDFDTVKQQLVSEWTAVPVVWAMITNLQSILTTAQAGSEVTSVVQQINQSLGTGSATVQYSTSWIIKDSMWALNKASQTEYGAWINYVGQTLSLASRLNSTKDGSPVDRASVSATDFATALSRQLLGNALYLDRERDILLGDWSKLQTAARNASDLTDAVADWRFTTAQATQGADGLMVAVRRAAYRALFPAAYSIYRLQAGTGTLPASPTAYQCASLYNGYFVIWNPFSPVQTYGSAGLITNAAGAQEDWVLARPGLNLKTINGVHGGALASVPSASLLNTMFGPPAANDPYQQPDTPLFGQQQFLLDAYPSGNIHITTVTHSSAKGVHGSTNSICNAS
jgi:hypothetical protein